MANSLFSKKTIADISKYGFDLYNFAIKKPAEIEKLAKQIGRDGKEIMSFNVPKNSSYELVAKDLINLGRDKFFADNISDISSDGFVKGPFFDPDSRVLNYLLSEKDLYDFIWDRMRSSPSAQMRKLCGKSILALRKVFSMTGGFKFQKSSIGVRHELVLPADPSVEDFCFNSGLDLFTGLFDSEFRDAFDLSKIGTANESRLVILFHDVIVLNRAFRKKTGSSKPLLLVTWPSIPQPDNQIKLDDSSVFSVIDTYGVMPNIWLNAGALDEGSVNEEFGDFLKALGGCLLSVGVAGLSSRVAKVPLFFTLGFNPFVSIGSVALGGAMASQAVWQFACTFKQSLVRNLLIASASGITVGVHFPFKKNPDNSVFLSGYELTTPSFAIARFKDKMLSFIDLEVTLPPEVPTILTMESLNFLEREFGLFPRSKPKATLFWEDINLEFPLEPGWNNYDTEDAGKLSPMIKNSLGSFSFDNVAEAYYT